MQIFSKLVIVLFSFGVFLGGLKLMEIQIKTGQISAALNLPMSVPYAAMVISFAMITLVQATSAIALIVDMKNPQSKEEKA